MKAPYLFQRAADGLENGGISGETGSALLDDFLAIHPHGEFTATAGLEIRLLI